MEKSIRKNNTIERTFVDRVQKFASVHDLFTKHRKYIVALSGGADSVALLLLMKELSNRYSLDVDAVHCNFQLRGKESNRDEDFCRNICSRLHIPLHIVHFDTREYANLHNVSIEMAARDLRYMYFENLRHDINAECVCVAHHRDDSVETVLLNLIRGTGIRGLRGIMPRNGSIIRPLLCMSKDDILKYLNSIGQDYVTDSSNLVPDVKRNRLRIDIIPLLKKINPSVQQSIFETAIHIGEALKLYDDGITKSITDVLGASSNMPKDTPVRLSLERLASQVSPESTLFHILNTYNFSSAQIKNIEFSINRTQQSAHFLSATHELCIDRGCIIIQPISYKVSNRQMRIQEKGTYIYENGTKFIISTECIRHDSISRDNFCASLDAALVTMPLTIRKVEEGDRFIPFGMKNFKLVSNYMTDRKFSIFEKNRQLVVTDAYGNIVWLVGERIDNRFCVNKNSTTVLKIKYFTN